MAAAPRKTSAAASRKKPAGAASATTADAGGLTAPGSPADFRARVRMYRQGLGDCFLLTFPRKGQAAFNMLIDCGALARDSASMTRVVEHIRDSVRGGVTTARARLDVVVGTHEHKDHVSGFNQARKVFNDDFDFGAVWLAWTENLTQPEISQIKKTRKKALEALRAVADSPLAATAAPLRGLDALLGFSADDDSSADRKVADAMEYLKLRGKEAGDLRFLEPGGDPLSLDGVEDVRVYVLGPPHDPAALKTSAVSEAMKRDDTVYHLSGTGVAGVDALAAAAWNSVPGEGSDLFQPFAAEHRITRLLNGPAGNVAEPNPYFAEFMGQVAVRYDAPGTAWRRIDEDWLGAFGQLALDLDSDTNNTSLVLAFEFTRTREVLLFVADAQVGSWLSWAKLDFAVPGQTSRLPALDLLRRTVFYKVGHHCSHNATLKKGGLDLMTREDLVAFIPLDKETASKQGLQGWEMPAPPLFKALGEKTSQRVVLSDVKESLSAKAHAAGVRATENFVDYFLL